LAAGELETVLTALRRWQPLDGDALLDDVGTVLDDVLPPEDEIEELAQRLRGHLRHLVGIAIAGDAGRTDEDANRLIQQAQDVRAQEMPGSYVQAVGHLRRMAWAVNELMDFLVAACHLRETA